jgi:large subunit ribosomal protein L15e
MGAYRYITKTIRNQYKTKDSAYKQRLIQWAKEPAVHRIERPTNLPRARTLGYKPKIGYVLVRVRIGKGRRKRRHMMGGRKSRHRYLYVQPQLSHKVMAEQKANRKFKNLEVLNAYWVGETGTHKYYEVILVDPTKVDIPAARAKGRAFRGLTH